MDCFLESYLPLQNHKIGYLDVNNFINTYESKLNSGEILMDTSITEQNKIVESLIRIKLKSLNSSIDLYSQLRNSRASSSAAASYLDHIGMLYNTSNFDALCNHTSIKPVILDIENTQRNKIPLGNIYIKSSDHGKRSLIGYGHGITPSEIASKTLCLHDGGYVPIIAITANQWMIIFENDLRMAYDHAVEDWPKIYSTAWLLVDMTTQLKYIMQKFFNLQYVAGIDDKFHQDVLDRNTKFGIDWINNTRGVKITPRDSRTPSGSTSKENKAIAEFVLSTEDSIDLSSSNVIETAILLAEKYPEIGGPRFSLEPRENSTETQKSIEGVYMVKSFVDDFLLNTLWGKIMFAADVALKEYYQGITFIRGEGNRYYPRAYNSKVSGYSQTIKSTRDKIVKSPKRSVGDSIMRFTAVWFELGLVDYILEEDTAFFENPIIKTEWCNLIVDENHPVGLRPIDTTGLRHKMVDFINEHFNELADECPALADLKQLGKLLAIIKYIKSEGLTLEWPKNNSAESKKVEVKSPLSMDKIIISSGDNKFVQLPIFPKCILLKEGGDTLIPAQYKFDYTTGGVKFFSQPHRRDYPDTYSYVADSLRIPSSLRLSDRNGNLRTWDNFQNNNATEPTSLERKTLTMQCAGFLPVIGSVIDLTDAKGHFCNGRYTEGWVSLGFAGIGLIPMLGTGAKILAKVGRSVHSVPMSQIITPRNLVEQLALKSAQNIPSSAKIIVPTEKLRDLSRLNTIYGNGEWVKMHYVLKGKSAEKRSKVVVHWYRDLKTNRNVEFKIKE